MKEYIPDLHIESAEQDGTCLLRIEQTDYSGNAYSIDLHPLHVHRLAELVGIVDPSHRGAIQELQTLRRRMLLLRDRIDQFDELLRNSGIERHADISELAAHSLATLQLVDEFCMGIPEPSEGE